MRNFDERLRDALIDANLLQFEPVLVNADAREFDFSSKYRRERMRMLADPFRWAKRQSRSVRSRAARNAACVLLACTVAFGALMAVSPTVRATVLNWLREFRADTVTYAANPYISDPAPAGAGSQDWRLTWLPEGYALQDVYINSSLSKWFFLSADSGESLDFSCFAPGGDSMLQFSRIQDPEGVRRSLSVRGCAADYYAGGSDQLLVWENPEGFLFRLTVIGQMDSETLVRIAESAACYGDTAPAYEIGWVPPDFHDMGGLYGNGAFQQDWAQRGVLLSLQYVVCPACPFAAPEGEAEEVDVNGLPGRFWAGPEGPPEDTGGEDNSVSEIGDVVIVSAVSAGNGIGSTLMWEDPETETAFCLKGELGKSDLLRMAESIKRKETPIERVRPGHSQLIIGAAGGEAG